MQCAGQEAYLIDGACTNWAEEYFSRVRRAEIGIHHHIAGAYLFLYAQESSWREDNRRVSNGDQVSRVAALAMKREDRRFQRLLAGARSMIHPKPKKAENVTMDTRPFAIVMLPPSEAGHGIALVGLSRDGALDFSRNFLFTYRPTREAQKSYATHLANMLRFQVLELSE